MNHPTNDRGMIVVVVVVALFNVQGAGANCSGPKPPVGHRDVPSSGITYTKMSNLPKANLAKVVALKPSDYRPRSDL